MIEQQEKQKSIWVLMPVFGTIVFVVLYIVATLLYPGGSQADKNAVGFSWMNNYWCNLLNENAMNGQHNPAKPFAMAGMLVLCITLSCFWYILPTHISCSKMLKNIIRIPGILAMVVAFFLFTNINHDLITNTASCLGLIATCGTFAALYKMKWNRLFVFGLFNILLVLLNNLLYYNKGLIMYLPVVQKITFAAFLLWVCCIDINLYKGNTGEAIENF